MTLSFIHPYEAAREDVISVAVEGQVPAEGVAAFEQAYDAALSQADGLESAVIDTGSGVRFGLAPRASFEIAYERARAWLETHDADLALVVPWGGVVDVPHDLARAVDAARPLPGAGAPAARAALPPQADKPRKRRFSMPSLKSRKRAEEPYAAEQLCGAAEAAAPAGVPDDLQTQLAHLDASFSETLLALIDARGLTDAQVYKRANISRQHFSKIRGDVSYRPKKQTVLAFAVALELTYGEAKTLLQRAGYTFSPSSPFDVIVGYYLERGIYDVFEINKALFAYDQQLLGSV